MQRKARRLSALFFVGSALLLPPVITAFNKTPAPGQWPVLPLYLFVAWGLVIGLAWYFDTRG